LAGHWQLPPGPEQLWPVTVQFAVEQHDVERMHCEKPPLMHAVKPERQVHVVPGFEQTSPATAEQSFEVQQVPSGMHARFCWQVCCAVGHTQLPIELQNWPVYVHVTGG
jgi:hypothetical protein